MYIKKYKRIYNTSFALTNSAIIYSNDLFVNQDLIEVIELVLKGKNPDPEQIKFEDCDSININKNSKFFIIPSLFDLRKNVLTGTKALLSLLIKEVVFNSKLKNETLNLLQNLLTGFDFIVEFEQLENLQLEIESLTTIKFELILDEVIEKYFAENFVISFFKNEESIKEEEINLLNSRIIYFKILELLSSYWDHEVFVAFDNPYLGLNYKETQMLEQIINKIHNKILIVNRIPNFSKENITDLSILLNGFSVNFPIIINNWSNYQFYFSKNYEPIQFLFSVASKMQNSVNLYDKEWIEFENLNHDEKLFWDNVTNQVIF